MAMYVYWYVLALILVGLEMTTGTFYLLMIAIALGIGGVIAMLGFIFSIQLTCAAVTGIVGIVALWHWKSKPIVNGMTQSLDIGQPVKILTWHSDRTARVFYRGAQWDAELDSSINGQNGVFYIKEIRGSVLILINQKINHL